MKHPELANSVLGWNRRFPLDRWWRNKHSVAFMSPVHRDTSFIYQMIEYEEDKLFHEMGQKLAKKTENPEDRYYPGIGDIFKTPASIEDFAAEAQREIEEMLRLEGSDGRQKD